MWPSGQRITISLATTLLYLFGVTGADDEGNILLIELRASSGPATVIPPRYAKQQAKPFLGPQINLLDSGALHAVSVEVGSPSVSVSPLVDPMSRDLRLPRHMLSNYKSASLRLTPEGLWQDRLQLDWLQIDSMVYFGRQGDNDAAADQTVMGLGLEDEEGPSVFETIVEAEKLDMPLYCITIERSNSTGQLQGHLLLGGMKLNAQGAIIRYNPIPSDFAGWGVRLNEIRVGEGFPHGMAGSIAVLDTTTAFTILPPRLFEKVSSQLGVAYEEREGVLMSRPMACSRLSKLPTLHFAIATDEYIWSAQRYAVALDQSGDLCMLAMAGYDAILDGRSVVVLGSAWLQDRSVIFDKATRHIGLSDYDAEDDAGPLVRFGVEIQNELDSQEL